MILQHKFAPEESKRILNHEDKTVSAPQGKEETSLASLEEEGKSDH